MEAALYSVISNLQQKYPREKLLVELQAMRPRSLAGRHGDSGFGLPAAVRRDDDRWADLATASAANFDRQRLLLAVLRSQDVQLASRQ